MKMIEAGTLRTTTKAAAAEHDQAERLHTQEATQHHSAGSCILATASGSVKTR